MFIIFLDNHKRVRKFIDSLSKSERKRIQYVLVTDHDMEDIGDLLPKKADVKVMQTLIPPQTLAIQRITDRLSKSEFQEEYYRYLTRPVCRAALIKIAKYAIYDGKDVAVCFGLFESDLYVPKYLKRAFDNMFPAIGTFDYHDWKRNPNDLINYMPSNIGAIGLQIGDYASQIGHKFLEMESCKDGYSRHEFYDDYKKGWL